MAQIAPHCLASCHDASSTRERKTPDTNSLRWRDLRTLSCEARGTRPAAAALEAFAPDVLIVDNVPRGALRELDLALETLRAQGRTRLVLGLRDILDDPVTLQGEWTRAQNHEAVRRYYDAVWVYGDPAVYDPVREYAFTPDVASKVRYTGYLDQRAR